MRVTGLVGRFSQIAYVDEDLEACANIWARTVGAGPFFVFSRIRPEVARYRGRDTDLELSLAFGYWGDVQIELIKQHSPGDSIYLDMQRRRDKSVNHIGFAVDSLLDVPAFCSENDSEIVQENLIGVHGGIYIDLMASGTLIELISTPPAFRELFQEIKRQTQSWDGTRPFRDASDLSPLPEAAAG